MVGPYEYVREASGSIKEENFWKSWEIINFPRQILLRGISWLYTAEKNVPQNIASLCFGTCLNISKFAKYFDYISEQLQFHECNLHP
jgi:hypothetical protein